MVGAWIVSSCPLSVFVLWSVYISLCFSAARSALIEPSYAHGRVKLPWFFCKQEFLRFLFTVGGVIRWLIFATVFIPLRSCIEMGFLYC